MSKRMELLERLETLERETGLTLAVTDPAQYRANRKELERLQKELSRLNAGKLR